jgi:hypothetical protein
LHPTEIKGIKLSDNYENKIILTIDVNTQKMAKSFSNEEPIVQAKKFTFSKIELKRILKLIYIESVE